MDKHYGHLKSGESYRVIKSFSDYDRINYEVNDLIKFIGSSFVPYEDGLSIFCKYNGADKQIRLQIRPEEQQYLVNNLELYLEKSAE